MSCLSDSAISDIPCCVILLDGRELPLQIKADEKIAVLYRYVCDLLGLTDDSYFGFRYVTHEGAQFWLSLKKPLVSQISSWMFPVRLYFGTKFYPRDPCKVSDVNARYQFYLQLRNDVSCGSLQVETVLLAELCALVLQSEIGDYNANTCKANYVSAYHFVRTQNEALETRIAEVHKLLRGIAPATAEFIYLDKAKWLDTYGLFFYPTMSDSVCIGVSPFGCVTLKRDAFSRVNSSSQDSAASIQPLFGGKISQHLWSRVTDCKYKDRILLVKTVDRDNAEHTHQSVMRDKLIAKSCCSHAREYLELFHRTHSLSLTAACVTGSHSQTHRSTSASRRRHCVAGGSLMIEDGPNTNADERRADDKLSDATPTAQTRTASDQERESAQQRADAQPARTSKDADADCGNFVRNANENAHDLSLSPRTDVSADGNLKDAARLHNNGGAFDVVSDCNANAVAIGVSTSESAETATATSGLRSAKTLRSGASVSETATDKQSAACESRRTTDEVESDDEDDVQIPAAFDRQATEQDFIERMRRKLERHAARNRTNCYSHALTRSVATSASSSSVEPLDKGRQPTAPPSVLSHIHFEPVDPAATGWSIDDVRSIPYTHIESTGEVDAAWLAQRRRIAQKYYKHRRHASGARFSNSQTSQRLLASRRGMMNESSGDETSVSHGTTRSEPAARRLAALTDQQQAAVANANQHQNLLRMQTPLHLRLAQQNAASESGPDLESSEREYGMRLGACQMEMIRV